MPLFLFSCTQLEVEKESSMATKNSESDDITFIINLKVNNDSNEDLNLFVNEITKNVINNEDFCLEYGYYVLVKTRAAPGWRRGFRRADWGAPKI